MGALETITSADHIEALLDQALEATFPASDPVALTIQYKHLPSYLVTKGILQWT